MGKFGQALVLTGIGGGLIAGGAYLFNLNQTGKKLQTNANVSIYSLNFQGLTLRIDLVLKNPTGTGITIKFPYVRLVMGDAEIGSSEPVNQNIKIPPYGEAHIDKIMVNIPVGGLLTLAASLFIPLQSGESVSIQIITITGISFLWMTFPYEQKEDVTLRVGSNGSTQTTGNSPGKKIQSPNSNSQANGNYGKAWSDSTGHSSADTAGGGSDPMANQSISQTA